MFTGMVDHCGVIKATGPTERGLRLSIGCDFKDLTLGESVAVDGACLTVTARSHDCFDCELSPETLNLTLAPRYRAGSRVNLERAMKLSDRLGGHLVTGHVDGCGQVRLREPAGEFTRLAFRGVSEECRRYLIPKGSVCVNGVSLTVNAIFSDGFEVMLVPHTLERTNLSDLVPGDPVNFEFDYLVKVILHDRKTVLGGLTPGEVTG